jgi:uncharacterized protein
MQPMAGAHKESKQIDPAHLVQFELNRIIINEMQSEQIIVLREVDGERKFPIVVGFTEAAAINRRIKGERTGRPFTHELADSLIEKLGATVKRLEIVDLRNGTFYAFIVLDQNGKRIEVDSRPSDAIAVGVICAAPIFVAERVLKQVC